MNRKIPAHTAIGVCAGMCRIATSLLDAVDDESVVFVIPFIHLSILYQKSFTHPMFLDLSVSILYDRITSLPNST